VSDDRILPDGCIDIVWNGRELFVAGPDTGPVLMRSAAAPAQHAGVRFRPGMAPALLGLPASELRDQRVAFAAIRGPSAARTLTERLALAPSVQHAAAELEGALVGGLAGQGDPLVTNAVRAIARVPSLRVADLADQLGVTERTLHRRVLAAVGYGPKVLARVVRFRRFLAVARSERVDAIGLAGLAGVAGYADQAHLTRECQVLAGLTPRELVRRADVRLVQDGLARFDPT
jgi:AraC-like DNA-binding protein